MPILSVKDFSCIQSATFELRPITILIGRQASGKSVIAKLFHFFSQIQTSFFTDAEDQDTVRVFKKNLAKSFLESFPLTAWGDKNFELSFEAGNFKVFIRRKTGTKKPSGDVDVTLSSFFEKHYEDVRKQYRIKKRASQAEDDPFSLPVLESTWRIRMESYATLTKVLKDEFIYSQTFVPAGRSFYTNLQKTVTVFEHGSQIDSVTKTFGRLFIDILDGDTYFAGSKPNNRMKEFFAKQKQQFTKILGGELRLGKNDQHLATEDGRKVPFKILSSGQQELLPLLLVTKNYAMMMGGPREEGTSLLYIEEPEAHLFPSSQGAVTDYLASLSNYVERSGKMIITTHSPYVLSRLNTLIKAHSVAAKKPDLSTAVEKIIPKRHWLAPASVAAYSISARGVLQSISENDGLIDADYLDSFSEQLNEDFMALLDIEYQNEAR